MSEFFTNDLPRRFIHFLEACFETDFNLSIYRKILFYVFRLVRIHIQQADNFCNADYNSFGLAFILRDRDKAHRNALTYHRFLPRNDTGQMSIDKVHSDTVYLSDIGKRQMLRKHVGISIKIRNEN